MFSGCWRKAEYSSREQRTRHEFVAAASGWVVESEAPRPRARSAYHGALDSPGDRYDHVEAVSIPSPPSESARPRPRPLKPPPYSVAVTVKSGAVLPTPPTSSTSPIISHQPPRAAANTATGTATGIATGTQPQGVVQSVEGLATKQERPESSLPVRPERESYYRYDDSLVGGGGGGGRASRREGVRGRTTGKGSVAGESVRPSWYSEEVRETEEGSVAEESVRPTWYSKGGRVRETEEGSVAGESVRPTWYSKGGRVRETEEGSVAGESVRPSWYSDVGSELSLPRYSCNSTLTGSVAPRWPGETNSVVADSEGNEWNAETRSMAAESVRPSWIEETTSEFGQSNRMDYRDRWMDNDTEIPRTSVPLKDTKMSKARSLDAQAPVVTVRVKTLREDGLRPSKSSIRTSTTYTKHSLFGSGKYEKRSDGGRSDNEASDVGRGKGRTSTTNAKHSLFGSGKHEKRSDGGRSDSEVSDVGRGKGRTSTTNTKHSLFGSGKHEKRSDGGRSDSEVSDVGRGKGRTSTTGTKPPLFGSGKHEKRSDGGHSDSEVSDVGRGKGVAHVQVQVIKRGSTPNSKSTKRASRLESLLFKGPEDPTASTAAKGVQEGYKTRQQMQMQEETPFGSNSPRTMGGQSSSERAARPLTEIADPLPENPEDRGRARTTPQLGTDYASMRNKQSSQLSHEGPLLSLVKGTSSTSSTSSGSKHESLGNGNGVGGKKERARRRTISPSKRLGKNPSRAQAPREETAEVPRKLFVPSGKVSSDKDKDKEKNEDASHSAGKVFLAVERRGESPATLRPSPGKAPKKGPRVGRMQTSSPSPAWDHDNGPEKPHGVTSASPLKDALLKKISRSGGSKMTTMSSSPTTSTGSEGKRRGQQRVRTPGHDNAPAAAAAGVRSVGFDFSDSDDSTNSTAMQAKPANRRRNHSPHKRTRANQEPRADSADTPVFTPTDKPGETTSSKEARPSIKFSTTLAQTARTSAAAPAAAVGIPPGVLKEGPYKARNPQPQPRANTAGPSIAAPLVTPLNKKNRYTAGLRRSSWNSRRRLTPDLESVEEEALDSLGGDRPDGDDVEEIDDRDKRGEPKPSSGPSGAISSGTRHVAHDDPNHNQTEARDAGGPNASAILPVAPAERPKRSWNTRLPSYDSGSGSGSGMLGSSAVGALHRPGGDGASGDALTWLQRRRRDKHPQPLVSMDDSSRLPKKGSQRFSQSSSLDDSTDAHQLQQLRSRNMFSPNRFNPDAGALSWYGSVEGSGCNDSVRSFMTSGRNSSATSLASGRGPSDRKLAPQLSYKEKKEVARLKIDVADVHLSHRPVRGSRKVFKAELKGEMRAAKRMSMLTLSRGVASEVLETFDAELLALSRLSTPNIVKVYGASVTPGVEIIVVSELVEGGTLRDLLDNTPKLKHLNLRMRLSIARDVAAGMKSLYAHGMQHRHLSSKTILLTSQLQAKVYGFGLSMTSEILSSSNANDEDGPLEDDLLWASREVLAGAGFSEKSDVYSFGIVLWEIMQADGSLPYAGLPLNEVFAAKYNGKGPSIPRNTTPEISSLMESCWSNLPANRPSFDKIYQFFTEQAEGRAGAGGENSSDPPNGAMSVP